jgi:hypothetical protein
VVGAAVVVGASVVVTGIVAVVEVGADVDVVDVARWVSVIVVLEMATTATASLSSPSPFPVAAETPVSPMRTARVEVAIRAERGQVWTRERHLGGAGWSGSARCCTVAPRCRSARSFGMLHHRHPKGDHDGKRTSSARNNGVHAPVAEVSRGRQET